jgi:hypothetical protein
MDLLPYPADPCQPPLQFEFICGDVLEEPKCKRFFDDFNWESWKEESQVCLNMLLSEEGAKYLQAYVYFGFLRGVVGPSFKVTDCVDDCSFISLARMRDFLEGQELQYDSPERWTLRHNWYDLEDYTQSIPADLCLSTAPTSTIDILILIDALQYTQDYSQSYDYSPLGARFFHPLSRITLPYLKERILKSGWCPYVRKIGFLITF